MIFVTFKDALNEMLKNGSIWIAVSLVALIVLTVLFLFIYNKKRSK